MTDEDSPAQNALAVSTSVGTNDQESRSTSGVPQSDRVPIPLDSSRKPDSASSNLALAMSQSVELADPRKAKMMDPRTTAVKTNDQLSTSKSCVPQSNDGILMDSSGKRDNASSDVSMSPSVESVDPRNAKRIDPRTVKSNDAVPMSVPCAPLTAVPQNIPVRATKVNNQQSCSHPKPLHTAKETNPQQNSPGQSSSAYQAQPQWYGSAQQAAAQGEWPDSFQQPWQGANGTVIQHQWPASGQQPFAYHQQWPYWYQQGYQHPWYGQQSGLHSSYTSDRTAQSWIAPCSSGWYGAPRGPAWLGNVQPSRPRLWGAPAPVVPPWVPTPQGMESWGMPSQRPAGTTYPAAWQYGAQATAHLPQAQSAGVSQPGQTSGNSYTSASSVTTVLAVTTSSATEASNAQPRSSAAKSTAETDVPVPAGQRKPTIVYHTAVKRNVNIKNVCGPAGL